jgi:hypothetical protein
VPAEAGDEFLQLVVKTSFAPPPPAGAEVVWESTIESVSPRYTKNGALDEGTYVIRLTKEVPNDDGLLQVLLKDGRKPWLRVSPLLVMPYKPAIMNQEAVPGLGRGQPTKLLYVQFNAGLLPADAALLPGVPVLFLSQNFPNPNPKAAADTQKVLDLLDNIRIQLTKPNTTTP